MALKINICLSILFISFCLRANAQQYKSLILFHGDTVSYLQYNFVERSAKYVGKPVDSLLNDLEIPIIYFLPVRNFDNRRAIMDELVLEFNSRKKRMTAIRNRKDNLAKLIVRFFPAINAPAVDSVLRKKGNNGWYDEIHTVYSHVQVKEIRNK